MRGTGDHAVGKPLVHHHGAEVRDVLHGLARLFEGHALLLAQLRELGGEFLGQLGFEVVDQVRAGQVQAQVGRATVHVVHVAEDGQLRHALLEQLVRGLQDAVVLALRKHHVLAVSLSLLDQLALEHHGAHHLPGVGLGELNVRKIAIACRRHGRPQLPNPRYSELGSRLIACGEQHRGANRGGELSIEVVVAGTRVQRRLFGDLFGVEDFCHTVTRKSHQGQLQAAGKLLQIQSVEGAVCEGYQQ